MTNKVLGRIKKLAATILAVTALTTTMATSAFANARPIVPIAIETAGMTKAGATSHNFTVKAVNKTGLVKSDVNVRTKPWVNDGSRVIGSLGAGQKVKITGIVYKNGNVADWYRINWNGTSAYVSKSYGGIVIVNPTPGPQPTPVKKVMTVTGVSNYLGVRSKMTTDERYEIGRLYNGDKVTVLDRSNATYYLVRGQATGVQGYVLARFLK